MAGTGVGQQLLHEERVALGAAPDLVEELRIGRFAEDRGQLGRDVALPEAVERQELRPPAPAQLGEERHERVAGDQRLAAHRRHHQRPRPASQVGEQESEEVPGRAVGPMEVVEEERHERAAPRHFEPVEHPLEEPRPIPAGARARSRPLVGVGPIPAGARAWLRPLVGVGPATPGARAWLRPLVGVGPATPRGAAGVRARPVGVGPTTPGGAAGRGPFVGSGEGAERLDEGPVGRARLAAVDAPPEQHRRPSPGGDGSELPQQAGLPGAALAFDDDRRGPALRRRLQCRREPSELRLAADEGGRGGGSHASLWRGPFPTVKEARARPPGGWRTRTGAK